MLSKVTISQPCDHYLTPQMAISEMVDHNHNHEWPMSLQKDSFLKTFFGKIMTATELS